MALNIISLAMVLLRHREAIGKIVSVLPDLKTIFNELTPEQPTPPPSQSFYQVGSMEWLQESLNSLIDADLEVDGEYGPATNKAVADYQTKYGLKVDGWAGPDTVSSIVEELNKED